MTQQPIIEAFFDEQTGTVSYLVADPQTGDAAVIDPVLDFDVVTGEVDTRSAEAIVAAAERVSRRIVFVLETHAHADHLSAAPYIKERTGAPIGIGEHIRDVQSFFKPVFGAGDVLADGRDFDRLLADGDRLPLGALDIEVLHTPGHTVADVSYRIGDAVFVGDTLFMPDYGTARADFPGGDARRLFRSIRRLLSLPRQTKLFMCHDYKAPGRDDYRWETTVAEQREHNVQIHDGVTEEEFVAMRRARDATLKAPKLLLPSIQVNIRAGRFPPAGSDGRRYLRIPIKDRRTESPPRAAGR
jgi:glyoxylase-like metal-dependent hydrolase (beta-lactamase superfamily II)